MYQRAIVTFLDILGFSEMVRNRSAAEIAKVIQILHRFAARSDEADVSGLRVLAVSDSVVRCRPESAVSALFYELLDLLHIQGELVAQGVLVRGGVTCGEVAWGPESVFGPGFIEAYELESKFAVYPRIVVAPALLEALVNRRLKVVTHHDPSEEAEYVRGLLAQGDDGTWFIDYLRAFRSELDDPSQYPDYLRSHLRLITQMGKLLGKDGNRLSTLALKANWLARYHDCVVRELDEERHDLLVPPSTLPTFFSFEALGAGVEGPRNEPGSASP